MVLPKNTEERAIVRLRIPIRTVEVEEVHVDPETLEEVKQTVLKEVEQDVDDKTVMAAARVDALPYSVYLLNQSVPRQHRHELFSYLRKNYADHFPQQQNSEQLQKDIEALNNNADQMAETIENKFLEMTVHPDAMPLFDFEINVGE